MENIQIPEGIKNIIFDFGGVILNIDYNRTSKAFKELGCQNFDQLYSQQKQSGLFDKFEIGKISQQAFINELLRLLPKGTTPRQVIDSWNAMLLNLPQEKLSKLKELKSKYRTFLLSNTNAIHEEAFTKLIQKENNLTSFSPLFEKVYYSHHIGMRKPNKEVFEFVLKENNLLATETLFVDDSPQHLIGASAVGLSTLLCK